MKAVSVNVHFEIWNSGVEHGGEIMIGPDRVDAIARAGGGNKGGRRIARRRGFRIVVEGSWPGINKANEIRARGNAGERIVGRVVGLGPFFEENGGGRGEFGAGGEA